MNRSLTCLIRLILFVAIARPLDAHEVRPGYLEIHQRSPDEYDLLWKVPAMGDMRLRLDVALPDTCVVIAPPVRTQGRGAFVDAWSVRCEGGLLGRPVSIDGLSDTMTDVLARVERSDGTTQLAHLTPIEPSFVVEATPNALKVAGIYTVMGIQHIIMGIDHLFFVFGLLLLVRGSWTLLKTITAFTVAHSITLALASLGIVHVPGPPVNAAIALSIVFVAAEALNLDKQHSTLAQRGPWIVAFAFGLLHGLGFAGALTSLGLPQRDIPLALLTFNVGVEIGQLAFVAAAFLLWMPMRRIARRDIVWMSRLMPYGIGVMAAYWTIDRVIAMVV